MRYVEFKIKTFLMIDREMMGISKIAWRFLVGATGWMISGTLK